MKLNNRTGGMISIFLGMIAIVFAIILPIQYVALGFKAPNVGPWLFYFWLVLIGVGVIAILSGAIIFFKRPK